MYIVLIAPITWQNALFERVVWFYTLGNLGTNDLYTVSGLNTNILLSERSFILLPGSSCFLLLFIGGLKTKPIEVNIFQK